MANLYYDPNANMLGVRVSGVTMPDGSTATAMLTAVTLRNEDGTAVGTGANGQQVQGNAASAAADVGNPVKIGAVFNTTNPTVTTGQRVDLQATNRGELAVNPSYLGVLALQLGDSSDAVAASATATGSKVVNRNTVFNGSTWDRQRGDTTGTDVVLAARATAGGTTQYRRLATADTNAAVIKASAGRVYGYVITNLTAAVKFVKLFNKATAPTVGTDTPIRTIPVPANGIAAYHLGMGIAGFSSGIAIAATGAVGDTDTTALAANDLVIHVDYA